MSPHLLISFCFQHRLVVWSSVSSLQHCRYQLPPALCGDQPGHTECSCVNFTGVHKHMVHTVISIVCSLAYLGFNRFPFRIRTVVFESMQEQHCRLAVSEHEITHILQLQIHVCSMHLLITVGSYTSPRLI